jgi:hypothetical protein
MPGTTIASFILRFVRESSLGAPASAWRGIVRHIQTGEQCSFTRLEDAISFIARRVENAEEAGKPREEEPRCV